MKVAQKNQTNLNTRSVHLSHAPSMLNMGYSPSGHLSNTCPELGKHSRLNPPFTGITYYRVRAPLATLIAMSCIVMHLFALYLLFLPPLLLLDSETDAAATQYDYDVDDPSLLPEQPGKPPLITRYRLLYPLYCLH